jgi:hypothetical protein
VIPDGTGSKVTVSYSDTQQPWKGTDNLSKDPLFANEATGDYHEQSTAGRWYPAANGGAGGRAMDTVTSPVIDAGDPTSDYSLAPAPNGHRFNM